MRVEQVFSTDGKEVVILDQTIFQPQSQASRGDKGIITSSTGEFIVERVELVGDVIHHIGFFRHGMFPAFNKGRFSVGSTIECFIDEVRRSQNSEMKTKIYFSPLLLKLFTWHTTNQQ